MRTANTNTHIISALNLVRVTFHDGFWHLSDASFSDVLVLLSLFRLRIAVLWSKKVEACDLAPPLSTTIQIRRSSQPYEGVRTSLQQLAANAVLRIAWTQENWFTNFDIPEKLTWWILTLDLESKICSPCPFSEHEQLRNKKVYGPQSFAHQGVEISFRGCPERIPRRQSGYVPILALAHQ